MAGYIYCIQIGDDGPVKIGFTGGKPEARLKQLQTSSPFDLRLVGYFNGDMQGEALFHEVFSECRMRGEWFSDAAAVKRSFAAVAQWGGNQSTIPPTTSIGREALKQNFEANGVRWRYPDGTIHSKINWDELAFETQETLVSYERWEAAQ